MDQEVVIVGADGTEHVFPPGFDPKKAAAIVSGQGAPASQTEAQLARKQGNDDMGNYLAQTIRNIPRDLVDQGKGVISVLSTLAGATGELGSDIGNTARAAVGLMPYWQDARPNEDALKQMPAAILQHYADYLDPEKRALMVREHPVGLALDVAGAKAAGDTAVDAAKAVAPSAKAAIAHPVARAAGTAALNMKTGGLFGRLKAVLSAKDALDGLTANAPTAPSPASTAAPAAAQSAAMLQELLAREPNWAVTDAVPIDAITRDVINGGSIIESGESIPGLQQRIADLLKKPTKSQMEEAQRLAKAVRQRQHITAKGGGR